MRWAEQIAVALFLLALIPWVLIFGAIGYAALDSMVCWAHYGPAHVGPDGTRWLFEKCG